jgi:plasmid stabilization system protein ParE
MPRSYVLTELAQAELEDILRYIARRGNVDTALRVEDEFRIEFRRLAENPRIGHHRSPPCTAFGGFTTTSSSTNRRRGRFRSFAFGTAPGVHLDCENRVGATPLKSPVYDVTDE